MYERSPLGILCWRLVPGLCALIVSLIRVTTGERPGIRVPTYAFVRWTTCDAESTPRGVCSLYKGLLAEGPVMDVQGVLVKRRKLDVG